MASKGSTEQNISIEQIINDLNNEINITPERISQEPERSKSESTETTFPPVTPSEKYMDKIKRVDDSWNDLESARDALWNAMRKDEHLVTLFDDNRLFNSISRKMAYMKLLQDIHFHGWHTLQQVKDNIPQWNNMFRTEEQLILFLRNENVAGMSGLPLRDVRRQRARIREIIKERNQNPNVHRSSELKTLITDVMEDYIDSFDVTGAMSYLNMLYELMMNINSQFNARYPGTILDTMETDMSQLIRRRTTRRKNVVRILSQPTGETKSSASKRNDSGTLEVSDSASKSVSASKESPTTSDDSDSESYESPSGSEDDNGGSEDDDGESEDVNGESYESSSGSEESSSGSGSDSKSSDDSSSESEDDNGGSEESSSESDDSSSESKNNNGGRFYDKIRERKNKNKNKKALAREERQRQNKNPNGKNKGGKDGR